MNQNPKSQLLYIFSYQKLQIRKQDQLDFLVEKQFNKGYIHELLLIILQIQRDC